ncbi:MAG: hypothetical protein KY397_01285 [Gemmatimonadetes bacterium]|nr:hypothetical protein [Gemmatimonadota bacterium]
MCIEIAREAKQQYEKGTPLPEMREIVEAKYSRGLPGTPTPKPPREGTTAGD